MHRPRALVLLAALGCAAAAASLVLLITDGGRTDAGRSTGGPPGRPASSAEAPYAGSGGAGSTGQRLPLAGRPPGSGQPWYLAIGDSITYGFTVDPARASVNSSWALQMERQLAARGRPWHLYNVACPGETTATYRTHCRDSDFVPFLASQSQHDAAFAAIRAHGGDLRLILVDLGSNDLLRALAQGLPSAQIATQVRASLTAIVEELRAAAPNVPVILANYYNPLQNSSPPTEAQLELVNARVAQVAAATHSALADFHAAINGTTTPNPDLGKYVDTAHLDIHPTVLGQSRLAAAAMAVLPA